LAVLKTGQGKESAGSPEGEKERSGRKRERMRRVIEERRKQQSVKRNGS
jgi:hypothetical protein